MASQPMERGCGLGLTGKPGAACKRAWSRSGVAFNTLRHLHVMRNVTAVPLLLHKHVSEQTIVPTNQIHRSRFCDLCVWSVRRYVHRTLLLPLLALVVVAFLFIIVGPVFNQFIVSY